MTRKKTLAQLMGVAILFVASVASAQEQSFGPLPYDYLFASLVVTELDSGGIELGGSFGVAERIHVFGSYQDWELGDNVDRSILQLGAGYRWDVSPNVDLVARLSLASSERDRPRRAAVDDEGFIISGILRGWITDQVELSGEVLLDDSLGSDIDAVLEFGGQYYVNDQFSVGGRIRVDEDETTLFLGGRFYFRGLGRSSDPGGGD